MKSDINITPIYDKSTKDLWTIHGEKYLESIKPPSLLNNSDKIKKFQDWLDKNHPDWIDVPLNKSESKGYGNYGSKTRKAYETYGKEYYSGLSLVERMGGVEYDALSPKTLAWWERIISTDKTFSDKIQGVFDRWVQSYLVKHQGEEKYINDWGYHEYEKMFISPNYDPEYFDKLDAKYEEEMEKLEKNVKRFDKEDDNIMMALAIGNFVNIAAIANGTRNMYKSCFAIDKKMCRIDMDSFIKDNPKIVLFEEIFMSSLESRMLKLNMVNMLPNNVWERIKNEYGKYIKFCT